MNYLNNYTVFIVTALSLLIVQGCKKVVQVDLKNTASRIVIEGEITNITEEYKVTITRTVSFSDDNIFPPVTGATVQVKDSSNGIIYPFDETSPGVYTVKNFTGVPKHIYNLYILAEGKSYTASSGMPAAVQPDSITFALNTDFNNKKDINAVVNFKDPPGLGNYYQFIEYLNGKLVPNTFVFEDRLSDGRYIREPLFNDSTYLHKGDTLTLKMYCIDKDIYDYFFTLIQVTANNNNFQPVTPANPISNISNGALGYFSAHTVTREKIIVY